MIYLLTAIGLSPGGSSTVHIYIQTIHRTIQNNQYIEQHNNWRVRTVPRLGKSIRGFPHSLVPVSPLQLCLYSCPIHCIGPTHLIHPYSF
jgi:hypothetical protein